MSTLRVSNLQNASAASPAIVLDANSRATLNGLSYPTEGSLSGRNRIINGDMRIDQRNAGAAQTITTTGGGQYTLDRWFGQASQSSKFSVQRSTTAPAGFTNSLLVTSLSAYSVTSGDYFSLKQSIEGFNGADLAFGTANATTVTLSFRVYSSLTGTFGGVLQNGAFNRSYPFTYTISSANTWTTISVTIPGDTSGTWATDSSAGLVVIFGLGVGSTYSGTAGSWQGANLISATGATSVVATNGATFYITGVQLEAGSVATPFERRSYGQELALCQRYYYFIGNDGTNAAIGSGFATGTTGFVYGALPVEMRTAPTISYTGTLSDLNFTHTGVSAPANSLTNQGTGRKSYAISLGSATGTTNLAGIFARVTSASTAITFSAEL